MSSEITVKEMFICSWSSVLCFIIIATNLKISQGNTILINNQKHSSLIKNYQEVANTNVTKEYYVISDNSDKGNAIDKHSKQKTIKTEFPDDTEEDDDYDYNYVTGDNSIFPASAEELPECILAKSELYLSWWVNEDGSLKMPERRPLTNESGFMDLSLTIHTEDWIFSHITTFQASNPEAVKIKIQFTSNTIIQLQFFY